MKNPFKKLIPCLLLLLILCGCTPKDNRTEIQFASWGSKSEIDILKPILKEFETQNPDIKVDFMHIPQNYFQKIHLLFASKTSPDVIFINNIYLPVYANAGVLEPINNRVDLSQYEPNILKSLSWKNELYAIPRDVSNLVIFYNKDLFDKCNIAYPKFSWSFNDFLTINQKFKSCGYFGTSFEEEPFFFLPYLMSEGGGILSDDLSNVIINTSQSQKGLTYYANLRKKYHTAPLAQESASATMAQMFLQQKIAMHLSGRWLVPKYREEAKFDWDVVNFPNGDKGSIVPLDSSGWAVSKDSKNKEEAFKLVNYLSSKQSIEKLTESGLIVPARRDVQNSKYFLDKEKPHNSQVFINVIKTSKPTPISVNYREILDKLTPNFEKMFN